MNVYQERNSPDLIDALNRGGIGVVLTDTIYGLVAKADDEAAVEKLYAIRKRDYDKPCIVLIANRSQIWDRHEADRYSSILDKYWPGPVSIILPASVQTPMHIHRGRSAVAFRIPNDSELINLLKRTGPLVAPSANLQGQPPATSIEEAQNYFGDRIDFYADSGKISPRPASKLIRITKHGDIEVLR